MKSQFDINLDTLETTDLDNFITLYDECSGCMETYLKIIYGLEKICMGDPNNFANIIKTKTYDIKSDLKKIDCHYTILLAPFDTNIWNAIKHKQIKKISIKK